MGCLWSASEVLMGSLRSSYELLRTSLWSAHAVLMKCLWGLNEVVMMSLWGAMRCLWGRYEVFMHCLWSADEMFMKCLWGVYEVFMSCFMRCLWSGGCDYELGDTKRIKEHRFHRGPVRGKLLFARIFQLSMLARSGKRIKKKINTVYPFLPSPQDAQRE